MYDYPAAGLQAPPEIRLAIARFRKLPQTLKARVPLLYWLLGSGTPPYKMNPADALYGAPPPAAQAMGQKCANCRFAWQNVKGRNYICSQIAGPIAPAAWCRLWVA